MKLMPWIRAAFATPLFALAVAASLAADASLAVAENEGVTDAGGTYLNWWACPGDPHAASNVPFDCVAGGGVVYTLVGAFTLNTDVPHAQSMSVNVNIAFAGLPTIPPFWAIDATGCNANAFRPVKGMPASCGGHLNAFCGGDSNQCELVYTAAVVPGSSMVQLLITAARVPPNTTPLSAGQSYFAFGLNITMDGSAACTGCSAPVAIGFSSGTIFSSDLPPVVVSGTYPGAKPCATVNNGTSECARTPVQRLSWGRLKSIYR